LNFEFYILIKKMTRVRGIMGIFCQNGHFSKVLVVWGPESKCW
jgi:hypothetical protein